MKNGTAAEHYDGATMVVDETEQLSIPASYLPGTPKAAVRSVPLGTIFFLFL
jgi:hypothetical protein